MLNITLKDNELVRIVTPEGRTVRFKITKHKGKQTRVSFEADKEVKINREQEHNYAALNPSVMADQVIQ